MVQDLVPSTLPNPKEVDKSSNFLKETLLGFLCGSLWWPVFNTPSNSSFHDGPVCLLSLAHCGELNMPLIFICAVKAASEYIPLREIAKINAGWHILNEEQTKIFISLSTDHSASWGWEQIGSNNRVFQAGTDCLYEGQWSEDYFFRFIWEKSMHKSSKRKNIYNFNPVSLLQLWE